MLIDVEPQNYVEKTVYTDMMCAALKKKYEKLRDGIHISDVLLCPRRAVHRKLFPDLHPITPKELNYFTSGQSMHGAISDLALEHPGKFESDMPVLTPKYPEAHIDLYDKSACIPIEIKTFRGKAENIPKPHNVAQLKAYMALTDTEWGVLKYFLVMEFKQKPFKEFWYQMTAEKRKTFRNFLQAMYLDSKKAIDAHDYKKAINVVNDPDLNWLCRDCPLKDECMGIKK